ncbi:MAG: hypothetical protein ACM31C_17020 [Acidobacteriota bacterium]
MAICSSCNTTYAASPCSGAAREAPIRDVHALVAGGFAAQQASARPAPTTARAAAPTVHTDWRWLGAAAVATLSLGTAAYVAWRSTRPEAHVDVVPWATANGGGLAAFGRF